MNLLVPLSLIPLPIDLQNIILEYTGFHKLRNGKYIKQLSSRRLRKINTKIKKMPQKTNGYVSLKMSAGTDAEFTMYVVIGPSFYYSIGSTRL